MQNVQIETKGNQIVITVDASKTVGPSRSGKTTIIATTGGNQKVQTPDGEIVIGVNVYKARSL